jgi:hypothetical protein
MTNQLPGHLQVLQQTGNKAMILIAAIFMIAIVLMGASFEAMLKDRRRFDRANNARTAGHFAEL